MLLLCMKIIIVFILSHSVVFYSLAVPQTRALQTPLPMGLPRQGDWSELPFLSPGDPPKPGMEPYSFACPALADRFFAFSANWEAKYNFYLCVINL